MCSAFSIAVYLVQPIQIMVDLGVVYLGQSIKLVVDLFVVYLDQSIKLVDDRRLDWSPRTRNGLTGHVCLDQLLDLEIGRDVLVIDSPRAQSGFTGLGLLEVLVGP